MDKDLLEWVLSSVKAGIEPLDIAAAIAREIAAVKNLSSSGSDRPKLLNRGEVVIAPQHLTYTPDLIGAAYERSLDSATRRHEGVHYTPFPVAKKLAQTVLSGTTVGPICDPSVGGGAFLLGAAECMKEMGENPERIAKDLLWGIDIDAGAIEVTEAAIALWGSTENWVIPEGNLAVANSLDVGKGAFQRPPKEGFKAVIGNPPFQNQLQEQTTRSLKETNELRERWSVNAGPYADTAGYFLLVALSMLANNGRALLIQPQSILATADAKPIREKLRKEASLLGMWIGGPNIFEAGVNVCAPLIAKESITGLVQIWQGRNAQKCDVQLTSEDHWAKAISIVQGTPTVHLSGQNLGSCAQATAGFRDQYYGLIDHVSEQRRITPTTFPLITVGMIDPLRNRWGAGQFRFAGKAWNHPMVNLETLVKENPELHEWVISRLKPKVLVATQTKILEVLPDPEGILVPSTPTISVECDEEDIWKITAALSAPAVSASSFSITAGSALSSDTIKLSARQINEIPLPEDVLAWESAAYFAERAFKAETEKEWKISLTQMAEKMGEAYKETNESLLKWWVGRVPRWR